MATQVTVLDAKGEKAGKIDLPEAIFDVTTNVPLIHQVVVAQLAAARQGTHKTKRRGEVSGAGRKPFKQKGTGRARQGSIRAPQMTGGGIVHGPTPRDYSQRTPKKMIAAALLGALSDRARGGRVHVVESFVGESTPKTRDAVRLLNAVADSKNVLVVLEHGDDASFLSVRNLPNVHVLVWNQLNAYDVLVSDDIIFAKAAYEAFVASKSGEGSTRAAAQSTDEVAATEAKAEEPAKAEKPAKAAKAAKAEQASEPVALAAIEDGGFGADSAAPLEDGDAPEGFIIKGNKDSMKYHAPEGRWYEATVAEVWFRTAEAAEAAGFVEAGSKESIEANEEEAKDDEK